MSSGSYKIEAGTPMASELERLRLQSQQFKDLEKKLLSEAGLKSNHKVIELGAGPGYISRLLLDLIPEGDLLATEVNPDLFQILNENTKDFSSIRTSLCSVDSIDVPDGWADFIYGRFIFQHLPDPLAVLKESHRCCAPGGRIATVDSDDGFITMFPEIDSVQKFLSLADARQKDHGGDRRIGRKLQHLMFEAGFHSVRSRVLFFTPKDIPAEAFVHMVFGFKSTLVEDKGIVLKAHEDLRRALLDDSTFVSLGIVVTVGQKTE